MILRTANTKLMLNRLFLVLELVIMFFVLPLIFYFDIIHIHDCQPFRKMKMWVDPHNFRRRIKCYCGKEWIIEDWLLCKADKNKLNAFEETLRKINDSEDYRRELYAAYEKQMEAKKAQEELEKAQEEKSSTMNPLDGLEI